MKILEKFVCCIYLIRSWWNSSKLLNFDKNCSIRSSISPYLLLSHPWSCCPCSRSTNSLKRIPNAQGTCWGSSKTTIPLENEKDSGKPFYFRKKSFSETSSMKILNKMGEELIVMCVYDWRSAKTVFWNRKKFCENFGKKIWKY